VTFVPFILGSQKVLLWAISMHNVFLKLKITLKDCEKTFHYITDEARSINFGMWEVINMSTYVAENIFVL
jgi:hypothetical protein